MSSLSSAASSVAGGAAGRERGQSVGPNNKPRTSPVPPPPSSSHQHQQGSEHDIGHTRGPTAMGLANMATAKQQGSGAGSFAAHRDSMQTSSTQQQDKAHGGQGAPGTVPQGAWKTTEEVRLDEDDMKERYWRRWGPYVSERQWVSARVQPYLACAFLCPVTVCSHSPNTLSLLAHLKATVREDYSSNGDAWSHFPHEMARSRAYRWGEDGIAGLCDNHCRLAFSLALWNGKDRMLKERMFGLANNQGESACLLEFPFMNAKVGRLTLPRPSRQPRRGCEGALLVP